MGRTTDDCTTIEKVCGTQLASVLENVKHFLCTHILAIVGGAPQKASWGFAFFREDFWE